MYRHDAGSTKFSIVTLVVLLALSFFIAGCESKPEGPAVTTRKRRAVTGNRPQISVGGSAPTTAADADANAAAEAPAVSTVADIEGGLPNGLFPQMSLSFRQNGFGGGLVPDFRNPDATDEAAGGNQVSAPSSDEVDQFVDNVIGDESAPQGYMAEAVRAFQERRDSDAFKYLYGQILSDDETASKYPLQWYSGIAQPKVAIRFGVGVTYIPARDFSGKPPVIGDPEDVRLPGASSPSSQRGSDGDGVVGGGGRAAANANATPTARLDRVSGRTAANDPDAELSGSLSPGVMLVGEGKKEDLVDRAREMGLDVLLLFNVRVSSSRVPTGTANLKVINLHSDDSEVMFNSRSLKSDVVAKNRAAGISEKSDPVVSTLDSLFEEALDPNLRAQPLPPNLKPEHVAGRIEQLMSKSNPDPLSVAVEIVDFHRLELLDAELAEKALDKVLGEGKGNILLTGTTEARKAALEEYMPK